MTCCQELNDLLRVGCEHHDPYECPDRVVVRMQNGMIGLPIPDGGRSAIVIRYCPWCGAPLPPPSITCPRCGATSYNANDIEQGYCGRCHDFTAPDHQVR